MPCLVLNADVCILEETDGLHLQANGMMRLWRDVIIIWMRLLIGHNQYILSEWDYCHRNAIIMHGGDYMMIEK